MAQTLINAHFDIAQSNVYAEAKLSHANPFKRLINWCAQQEEKRFLWMGIALMGNMGMALPLTLVSIALLAGNNFTFWMIACTVNVPVLALNLAAQPTKVTLPALFIAWLVNALLVIVSVAVYLVG